MNLDVYDFIPGCTLSVNPESLHVCHVLCTLVSVRVVEEGVATPSTPTLASQSLSLQIDSLHAGWRARGGGRCGDRRAAPLLQRIPDVHQPGCQGTKCAAWNRGGAGDEYLALVSLGAKRYPGRFRATRRCVAQGPSPSQTPFAADNPPRHRPAAGRCRASCPPLPAWGRCTARRWPGGRRGLRARGA